MIEVPAHLRRKADLATAALEGLPEDLLAVTPPIDIRGIEERAPEIDRATNRFD